MPQLIFTRSDVATPERLERLFQRLNRVLAEIPPPAPPAPPLNLQALADQLAPLIRNQLQAPGRAPLNLQSLLPSTGLGIVLEDTHANRNVLYPASTTSVGTLYWETNRTVAYVVTETAGAQSWTYFAGDMRANIADRPADLGSDDAGFLFFASDESTIYIWTGSAWDTVDKRILFSANFAIWAATLTANRTFTLPDASGNVPALPTAATTETGTGAVVRQASPSLTTPTIGDFTNAQHNHLNAAGGGNLSTSALTTGTLGVARGGTGYTVAPARSVSSPADPTGTTSTTGVMMGLAGTITPTTSGSMLVTVTMTASNTAIGNGTSAQLRYGTGSAPANGDALTGTTAGVYKNAVFATAANRVGLSVSFLITGLTPSTAYWLDLGVKAVTGGTASVFDIDIVAVEV